MTNEQITNAFEAVLGIPPRQADLMVLQIMGTDSEAVAEYIWDHWLGEPDEPSFEAVHEVVARFAE